MKDLSTPFLVRLPNAFLILSLQVGPGNASLGQQHAFHGFQNATSLPTPQPNINTISTFAPTSATQTIGHNMLSSLNMGTLGNMQGMQGRLGNMAAGGQVQGNMATNNMVGNMSPGNMQGNMVAGNMAAGGGMPMQNFNDMSAMVGNVGTLPGGMGTNMNPNMMGNMTAGNLTSNNLNISMPGGGMNMVSLRVLMSFLCVGEHQDYLYCLQTLSCMLLALLSLPLHGRTTNFLNTPRYMKQ